MAAGTSRRTGTTALVPSLSTTVTVTNNGPGTVLLSNGTQLSAAGSTSVTPSSGLWATVPAGSYADVTVDYADAAPAGQLVSVVDGGTP